MTEIRNSSSLEARQKPAVWLHTEPLHRLEVRKAGLMVAMVCCIPLSLVLTGCGSNARAFSSTASPVVSTPSSVEFGDVTVGTRAAKDISIANSGKSAVEVTSLSSSSGAFTVSSAALPATLLSGQSIAVKVHYDAKSTAD